MWKKRAEVLKEAAQAVLALAEQGPAVGQKQLGVFLNRYGTGDNLENRRREPLEVQLFCAELLIHSEMKDEGTREAAGRHVIEKLEKLVDKFPFHKQMLPYLRRYYDIGWDAFKDSEPQRAATYALLSRDQSWPQGNETLVVFHLQPSDGLALVIPPDGPGQSYRLDFGRRQVKQRTSGQTIALPAPLADLLRQGRADKRRLVVSWSDAICWSDPAMGLSDADWPFGKEFPVDGLRSEPLAEKTAEGRGK